ncbi:MAG: hypothetical protein L7R83_02235, partial [Candidatus Poseidonia sp.]|nr:hypothetical protein [Poseidonia sp.]
MRFKSGQRHTVSTFGKGIKYGLQFHVAGASKLQCFPVLDLIVAVEVNFLEVAKWYVSCFEFTLVEKTIAVDIGLFKEVCRTFNTCLDAFRLFPITGLDWLD